MKGVELTDIDVKFVYLPPGRYLIDDEIVNVNGYNKQKVPVKNINDIRIVTANRFISYYMNEDEKIIKPSEYKEQKDVLLSKSKYDDEYDEATWDSLEDEFAYKKFLQNWKPIYKTVQEISDPIKVEVVKSKITSKHKYIKNMFSLGNSEDVDLFVYDRYSACLNIVRDKFESLGMKYAENIHRNSTIHKKIWSNSTHSCIEYVIAFGTYIFDGTWDIKYSPRGTFEDLEAQYNKDKKILEDIIQTKYNFHFKKDVDIDLEVLYKKIESIQSELISLDVKVKAKNDRSVILTWIQEVKQMIEGAFENCKG